MPRVPPIPDAAIIATRRKLAEIHAIVRENFRVGRLMQSVQLIKDKHNGGYSVEIDVYGKPAFRAHVEAADAYEARYEAWRAFLRRYPPAKPAKPITPPPVNEV